MGPLSIQIIEEKGGTYKNTETVIDFTSARFKSSDSDIGLFLADPEKKVVFVPRPNGLQLTSQGKNGSRTDFSFLEKTWRGWRYCRLSRWIVLQGFD